GGHDVVQVREAGAGPDATTNLGACEQHHVARPLGVAPRARGGRRGRGRGRGLGRRRGGGGGGGGSGGGRRRAGRAVARGGGAYRGSEDQGRVGRWAGTHGMRRPHERIPERGQ